MVENIICPICNSHNWRGQKPSAMGLNHPEWWIKLCAELMLTLQRTEIGIDINLAFPRKESSTGIFSISVRIYWKITWRDLEGNPRRTQRFCLQRGTFQRLWVQSPEGISQNLSIPGFDYEASSKFFFWGFERPQHLSEFGGFPSAHQVFFKANFMVVMKLSTLWYFCQPTWPAKSWKMPSEIPNFECLVVNSRCFASYCNFRDFGIAMENGSLIDDLNAFQWWFSIAMFVH